MLSNMDTSSVVAQWVHETYKCQRKEAEGVAHVCEQYGIKTFDGASVVYSMTKTDFKMVLYYMDCWISNSRPRPEEFDKIKQYLEDVWFAIYQKAAILDVILNEMRAAC